MDRNILLRITPKAEFKLLEPLLTVTEVQPREKLSGPRQSEAYIYFVLSGACEVWVRVPARSSVSVGLIGIEGMIGTCYVCGVEKNALGIEAVTRGVVARMPQAELLGMLERLPQFRSLLLRYVHLWSVQLMHTAFANAEGSVKQRVARWILMLHDRTKSNVITITHEAIAGSLNVRRPGVTSTLKDLAAQGMIEGTRGGVIVKDRARLIEVADGLYGGPEQEYRRLLQAA